MTQPNEPFVNQPLGRRTLMKGAGLGLVAGGLTATLPAPGASAATEGGEIWSSEYWAKKGDVPLWMFRKRVGAPKAGEPAKPVVFFVHGSSVTSRCYDLNVPGKGEYSALNEFARYGFDVWTMDHENYGHSSHTSSNSDIPNGAADLKAAAEVVARETGQRKVHYVGESSGAIRAALFAQNEPDRVDRLVLNAFTYKGTGSPEISRRAANAEKLRASNKRLRDAKMIRSIFQRDGLPGAYDQAVADAIAAEELKFGDQVPTGTYLDMAVNLPLVDPKKVLLPVLMVRGDHDGNSTNEDLLDFYAQLPNGDRQFVILPHTAHSLGFGNNRHLLWYAVCNFLLAPPAIPAA